MPQPHGPCDDLKLSLGILANSVRNIHTAISIQKSSKQFATVEHESCLGYSSISIDLLFIQL